MRAELNNLEKEIQTTHKGEASGEMAAFVTVHRMMLDDPSLSETPRDLIRRESCNAEWALKLQLDELLAQFAEAEEISNAAATINVFFMKASLVKNAGPVIDESKTGPACSGW